MCIIHVNECVREWGGHRLPSKCVLSMAMDVCMNEDDIGYFGRDEGKCAMGGCDDPVEHLAFILSDGCVVFVIIVATVFLESGWREISK